MDPFAGFRFATIALSASLWPSSAMGVEEQQAVPDSPRATGCLQLRVVDEHGVGVPGAAITVSVEGETSLRASSDRAGEAEFEDLRLDQIYTVEVEFPGYAKVRLIGVPIAQDGPTHRTVQLTEAQEECVILVCPGPLIDLGKTSVSTVFSAASLEGLPGGAGYSGHCSPYRMKPKRRDK